MHTERPNRCLKEIARILKRGGRSWIYVYGSGGVYWRSVQHFRSMLNEVEVRECIGALQLLRYETRYVAEFIDDWFATHLRSYTHTDFSAALTHAGFAPRNHSRMGWRTTPASVAIPSAPRRRN